jgi:hypothetical protein
MSRALRRIDAGDLAALGKRAGAELSFGKPVRSGDVTVIPVARVWAAGGLGFGSDGQQGGSDGGGGGGIMRARPVGYVEASPNGSRLVPIRTPLERTALVAAAAAVGAALAGALGAHGVATAAAGALPVRRRRRGRRSWRRRSRRR